MNRHPNPAIVSQAAVRALPRWAVALVCLMFVLPGFVGRDPWRSQELAALAVMLDMAWFNGPWLRPEVLGQAAQQWGLLPYWLGALSIQSLGWINAAWAAQLPFIALIGLMLWATWHSAFLLAVQPAAQPVSFAFGGEAQPKDYARAIADGALLLLVACLGLALLAHEITVDAAKLAFASVWFLGWVRWLLKGHQTSTLLLWTVGSLGLSLSGAPMLATVWVGLGVAAVYKRQHHDAGTFRVWQAWAYGLPTLLLLGVLSQLGWSWPALSGSMVFEIKHWRRLVELLTWFTWPAGIFGVWALWKWRRHWAQAHIYMPSLVVVVVLIATFFQHALDRVLLLGLPALAVLAALALPTLRRSVIALVDWFAVLFFSFGAIFIWVMWLAMMTGIPAKPAANVARLAPSFNAEFSWVLWVPALAATIGWGVMIAWRLGRSPVALWKPVALSASGAMLCWVLLMTLWLPLLNHGMGLSPVSKRIASLTGSQSCVAVHALPDSYVGGLIHHGQLQVYRASQAEARACPWLVVAPSAYEMTSPFIDWSQWSFMQTVPRLRESSDSVILLQRKTHQ